MAGRNTARTQAKGRTLSRALLALAAAVSAAIVAASCSLGNVAHDDCTSDSQCAAAFGGGSRCEQGYCTESASPGCQKTGADGRACFGCAPKVTADFQNACTDATCAPFDDEKRLTRRKPDGGLPPLP
jgi:hypothetical protein